MLQKGLSLIRANRDFDHEFSQWAEKPDADKNCSAFKTHCHEVQFQSKDARVPRMQQTGHYHDNYLAQQINSKIQQQLSQRESQMIAMMQSVPGLAESNQMIPNNVMNIKFLLMYLKITLSHKFCIYFRKCIVASKQMPIDQVQKIYLTN